MRDDFLLGDRFTVADAYLFVILTWARKFEVFMSPALADYFGRVEARPSVRQSLLEEGIDQSSTLITFARQHAGLCNSSVANQCTL